MFVLESSELINGGKIEWEKHYRIRHYTSNRYLALDPLEDDEVNKKSEIDGSIDFSD
jgi:hypothetical protein